MDIRIVSTVGSEEAKRLTDAFINERRVWFEVNGVKYTGVPVRSSACPHRDNSVRFTIEQVTKSTTRGETVKPWKFKSIHPLDIDFNEIAESVTRQNPIALVTGTVTERKKVLRHKVDRNGKPVMVSRVVEKNVRRTEQVVGCSGHEESVPVEPMRKIRRRIKAPVVENYHVAVKVKNECYVVIHPMLWTKSVSVRINPPENTFGSMRVVNNSATVIATNVSMFSEWLHWAKAVKAASWPYNDRRRATFSVTLPEV